MKKEGFIRRKEVSDEVCIRAADRGVFGGSRDPMTVVRRRWDGPTGTETISDVRDLRLWR
jgi:hypothetical protein